jgi:hypothetical protein
LDLPDLLSQSMPTRPAGVDASTLLSRSLEWVRSPVDGLSSAHEWSIFFRNDEQLETLTDYFDRTVAPLNFTTAAFEHGGDASFNWYLRQAEQNSIRREAVRLGTSQALSDPLT